MELAALVLLDDNADAVKLVASWPVAGAEWSQSYKVMDVDEDNIIGRWSQISGVDQEDVVRLLPMLFENGILYANGKVDDNAKRYLNAKVAAKLPKART